MQRNNIISIAKGIAIILMVVGHAEAPELLTNFIYTFHMPLFFITAGYFFSLKYTANPWSFCEKRFKGLYIPFLKWSLVFLLLHNVFFHFGILNEQFGNWTGGVTHPYAWKDFANRLLLIVTSMSGYDEFMAGAFWFFRGLLVASILFLVFFKLLSDKTRLSPTRIAAIICIGALAFTAFRIGCNLKLRYIPNGGMREIWGLFFFGIGFLYRQYEPRIKEHWGLFLAYFSLLCLAAWLHLSGMNNSGKMIDILTLPLTGTIGFLAVRYVSAAIDKRETLLRNTLIFIGENTLYIFIFHIISFKLVSLTKIWWYDLDFAQIGCHMVIHYNNHSDLFWIAYSIAGVAVPLICLQAYRRCRASVASRIKPIGSLKPLSALRTLRSKLT